MAGIVSTFHEAHLSRQINFLFFFPPVKTETYMFRMFVLYLEAC